MSPRLASRVTRAVLVFAVASLRPHGVRADNFAIELPASFAKPQGIIAGPDGNVWVAEEDGNKVTRISPTGTVVGSTPLSPAAAPASLAIGNDGNVWVTEPGANKVARLDGKTGALQTEISVAGSPEGIAAGPDGRIWFTENDGDKIGRVDTTGGNLAEFPLPPGSHPNGIVAGPCGDPHVWFTEEDGHTVGAMDLTGNVTSRFDTGSASILRGIAAGAGGDCHLYYADRGNDRIGQVSTDGSGNAGFVPLPGGSRPIGVVVSASGDVWVTLNGANAIARVPAAGTPLTTYAIPTPNTFPDGIGLGPSGGATIYFTEAGGDHVGYVSVGGSSSSPDLAVSKTVRESGDPGHQTLAYTVTYTNHGTQAASNVVLSEYVPFLTTFAAPPSDPGWACDAATPYAPLVGGGTCRLNLETVGAGATGTATFVVEEGATAYPVLPDFPIYNLTTIAETEVDANSADNGFDLSTPDIGCSTNADPLQFLLCVAHGPTPSGSLFTRIVAKVQGILQQLRVYFQLRDSVFLTSPAGRRWFDNYRRFSPELRSLLGNDATLRSLGVAVVNAWEGPFQTYLGHGGTPTLSPAMYASMAAFLDRLRTLASPDLRALLNFPRFQSQVGLPLDQYVRSLDQSPCHASDASLCLHGARFRIEARWRAANGNTGVGHGVPLTGDSGYFWFFSESNVEVLVKALDGCGVDGKFWVFAGGLTNVQLTLSVTDTATGQVKEYSNPANTPFEAILDTGAFETCSAAPAAPASSEAAAERPAALQPCEVPPTTLCLDGGLFTVEATYRTSSGASGSGHAVALTSDTGYFWFFAADNVEVIVKVLDGCGVNGRRWVFAAGLTDVAVHLTVTNVTTGEQRTYDNALGTRFEPIQDTAAFACP